MQLNLTVGKKKSRVFIAPSVRNWMRERGFFGSVLLKGTDATIETVPGKDLGILSRGAGMHVQKCLLPSLRAIVMLETAYTDIMPSNESTGEIYKSKSF